jgi:hypothetical protein
VGRCSPRTQVPRQIDALHARYVEAVNVAVAADDLPRADQLAAAYDAEAIALIAEREGLTKLLPLRRSGRPDSRLRAMIRRLTRQRAA